MSYTKNNWSRGDVISSAKLNNIESGIETIATNTDSIVEQLTTAVEQIANVASDITNIKSSIEKTNSSVASLKDSVGDSLADAGKKVAVHDIDLASLNNKLDLLVDKINKLSKNNVDVVTELTESYSNVDKDFVAEEVAIPSGKLDVTAKTIELAGSTAESAHVGLTASGDIVMTGVVTSGELAKSVSNAGWSINTSETVTIKDCDFSQSSYNSVEIGLSDTAPKNVVIENCKFGDTSNNSILVFATANDATVTVKNCKFGNVSQVLRLSNRTNATGVTVNMIDCEIESTDSDLQWPMILCQDYMSGTGADIKAANRFAKEKITINIINCKKAGKLITAPEDIASVCNSKDENGLIVVYNNYENSTSASKASADIVDYGDGSRYPTLNII